VVEARAAELGMPTENLLTPELLRRVAWAPPAAGETDAAAIGDALLVLGARPWQIEETAQLIADAFVASVQSAREEGDPAS
jgi:ribonuclease D